MTITTTYKIASLDDLAEHFEKRASECAARIADGGARTKNQKARDGGRVEAYEECAHILRNTIMDVRA